MFNKQELEYIYIAVNQLPPPPNTQGGKVKAHMINKLCDMIDEAEGACKPEEPELKEVKGGKK
jgi:hypothetical protein